MIHFKDNKNKSALSTRWAQMSKQEQIIERKKMELQAKFEAQRQAAALAAHAKLTKPTSNEEIGSVNIFSNDGSFMNQFKALLEKQKQDTRSKEVQAEQSNEEVQQELNDPGVYDNEHEREYSTPNMEERRKSTDKGQREKHWRWNDRSKSRAQSPSTPVIEDRKKTGDIGNSHNIPSLMQIPIMPPSNAQSDSDHQPWMMSPNSGDDHDSNEPPCDMGPAQLGPPPMPPGLMGPNLMGPGPNMAVGPNMGFRPNMGPGPNMGHGPNMRPGPNMGPCPNMGLGPNNLVPRGNMRPGSNMGQGSNLGPRPNMGPGSSMGLGPNMGPRPNMGPGPNMGLGRNMGPGSHMGPGPNMGPSHMMGPMPPGGPMPPMPPGGPMRPMPPIPPFMGGPPGPPNFPMPPNFMGPNGPCGPMPPNMCGPNMPGGPNGPMPPFFGPPFPNPMMGPNVPPNSLNNSNLPFMRPRPPFPPNGPPNFGNGNGPPLPFMPPTPSLPPSAISDSKPFEKISLSSEVGNIQPPLPPTPDNQMSDRDVEKKQPSMNASQDKAYIKAAKWFYNHPFIEVLEPETELFLHNTNSNDYKMFKELVIKYKNEKADIKPEIKPEDKYEPEFSLEDDDSNDDKPYIKEEIRDSYSYNRPQYPTKRDQTSSQSDEEYDSKRDKRKKKSRWSDGPPAADIKPPGIIAPMPPCIGIGSNQGPLVKIDEEGLRLGAVNRNNQALMQYAMTNYGTTNLSGEDWKKCQDNFKLNLLYQDMLKKRQEVERLAAAGKYKYEYDSDEDTSEGTWEHKLRAKEMNATEKWATELTKQAAGKHHIGDFLPPEELKKFMEKYSAVKSGKEPDLSDYKEFKLKEDNVGFKMLQKLGWSEGQGLGAEGSGIVEPINKAKQPVANLGLGADTSDVVSPQDDEFDAYRKRMMLAYRFRPNPLNNPRRPYY